jgi:hypothetical protein
MSDSISETNNLSDQRLTFDATKRNGRKILALFSAGVLVSIIYVIVLIWFWVQPSIHSNIEFPIVFGLMLWYITLFFLFIMVFYRIRIAQQVILNSDTIIINGYGWSKRIKYESITKIYHQLIFSPDKPPYPNGLLILLGWNGKVIGRIPTTMTNFELFEAELSRRVQNVTGKQVYSREEELIEKRRNKKRLQQAMAIGVGLMFLSLCCQLILLIQEHWKYSKKQDSLVSVEATIKQHQFFNNDNNNGGIHLLEYVFTIDGKEYTNKKIFDETEWINLKGKETITVHYILNNPNDNFLEKNVHYPVKNENLMLRWALLGFMFLYLCFMFLIALGYDFVTYNGTRYLLKPDQILEDRLDELAKHSNKCSDKQ